VGIVPADVFQIVVLPGHSHTLLGIDGAIVRPSFGAEKNVFELHHPGVGKKQSLVPTWHERGGGYEGMAAFREKIDKCLADRVAGQLGWYLLAHVSKPVSL
jgi:hypothetical protein